MPSPSIATTASDVDPNGSPLTRRHLAALTGASLFGITACATLPSDPSKPTLQIPMRQGWFEGVVVVYITTDVSDAAVAAKQGANFAPRLTHTLPQRTAQPGQPSSLDRVYEVTNFKQASIFASAPKPMGATNAERAYSPLWRMVEVTWQPGRKPEPLTSEEQVLAAEERGAVKLNITDVVLNCPIVYRKEHGGIPGVVVQERV